MTKEIKDKKFTYNDGVIVNKHAPETFNPGELGTICGFSKIETGEGAKEYKCSIGEWIYIVEFPDGSSTEIAECYLETDPDRLKYCLGEQVLLKHDIPNEYHPSEIVSIMSYHEISEESLAKKFNLKIGDILYIVKIENDMKFFIPEHFIEKRA